MTEPFKGWAILEIMGHRVRPGFVEEVEIAGGKLLRIDIPTPDGEITEFYGTASIYSLRPCSEEMVRDAANRSYGTLRKPVRPMEYRSDEQLKLSADIDRHLAGEDGSHDHDEDMS